MKTKSGDELSEAARDADFYRPIDMKKLYARFTVSGEEEIGGRMAYLIEATNADSTVEKDVF